MLPVSDGSVIAATTPIIVRESKISAIVNAIRRPRARKPIMAVDSVDSRLSNSTQRLSIVAEFVRSLHSRSSRNGGIVQLRALPVSLTRTGAGSPPFAVAFTPSVSTDCLTAIVNFSLGSLCGCRSATGSAGPPPPCQNTYNLVFHLSILSGTLPLSTFSLCNMFLTMSILWYNISKGFLYAAIRRSFQN